MTPRFASLLPSLLPSLLFTACAVASSASPTSEPGPQPAGPAGPDFTRLPWEAAMTHGLALEGGVVTGARWRDIRGDNVIVLTRTEPTEDENEALSQWLYGFHYRIPSGGGSWSLVRKVQDFIQDCQVDMTVEHVPGSLEVTDVDGDGLGEATFAYLLACKGDISAPTMKLMMLEDDQKYALRGDQWLFTDTMTYTTAPGVATVDPAFEGAPPALLEHAQQVWKTYAVQVPIHRAH